MRLRRLELVIIGLTLAFAFFMGGFFTGRSWSAVNITAVTTQNDETRSIGINLRQPESSGRENTENNTGAQEQTHSQTSNEPAKPVIPDNIESDRPAETIGSQRAGDGKININLASQSELTDLPGIGAVLASRIIDYRRQNGDFFKIEDLRNVSGIGEKRYEAIQDKITVG